MAIAANKYEMAVGGAVFNTKVVFEISFWYYGFFT